jgi:hypothetical protein
MTQIIPKPGMRVKWGRPNRHATGTFVAAIVDEDGDPELCGQCEPPLQLWSIRFDDGEVKPHCCPASIIEVLPELEAA